MADNPEASSSSSQPPGAPVQRLDSIRGGRGKSSQKFKPKAVQRRAQTERDALEKDARAREAQRLAEVTRQQEAEARRARLRGGHFGKSRGRGAPSKGMFAPAREKRPLDGASGPFSGPSADTETGPRTEWARGRGGGATSSRNTDGPARKEETSPSASRRKSKIKDEEEGSAIRVSVGKGSEPEGKRRNIDYINLDSDEEDNEVQFISRRRLRPVRLDRDEHIERKVGVNTDASSAKAAEIRRNELDDQVKKESPSGVDEDHRSRSRSERARSKGKDVEFVRNERRWKGVYTDEDAGVGTQVKLEPGVEDTEMAGSVQGEADPLTHEVDSATRPAAPTVKGEEPVDEVAPPTTAKRRPPRRFYAPVLQTDEDKAEHERYLDSKMTLVNELRMPDKPISSEEEASENQEPKPDLRQNRVYLFQLPPTLPNLRAVDLKGKGKYTSNTEDTAGSSSQNAIPVADEKDSSDHSSLSFRGGDDEDFTGQIGTLSIYDDGSSSFSWGGIEHEMNLGCGGDLLQEVIIAEVPRDTTKEQGENEIEDRGEALQAKKKERGQAMAVGQLSGKFVVTPEWSTLFEKA